MLMSFQLAGSQPIPEATVGDTHLYHAQRAAVAVGENRLRAAAIDDCIAVELLVDEKVLPHFSRLRRTDDAFFVKVSYLFRALGGR